MLFICPFNLYMRQSNNKLSFLDVFRKPTNTDVYIHWNSFHPIQWKYSTLKSLVYCSYLMCSNDHYLTLELKYLVKVFKEYSNYPHWFITQNFNDVNKIFNQQQGVIVTNEMAAAEESNSKKQIMMLLYAGDKGCSIIKSLKKHCKKTFPANIEADIICTGTKLSSQLNNIKDSTLFESSMI